MTKHFSGRCVLILMLSLTVAAASQITAAPKTRNTKANSQSPVHLAISSQIEVPSEVAGEFGPSMRCDQSGNLYLNGEVFGTSALRKISPEGKRVATFDPKADSHISVDYLRYFVLGRGDLYALAYAKEITRYVLVYDSDGKYKSTIKLDPGFPWQPKAFAVFQTGEMLFTGSRYVRVESDEHYKMVPFTGLFKAGGELIKELSLDDDSKLQKLAEQGDARYASPRSPSTNRAIDFSQAEPGGDGNIYLMRWTNPAVFYVISPSGEVVRRFTVTPDDDAMNVLSMHVSGNRIATLFTHPSRDARELVVTDLEGKTIATYINNPQGEDPALGMAFACFSADPQKFTFLGMTDDNRLKLTIADAR